MRFRSTFSRGVTLACALLALAAPVAGAASGDGERTPLNLAQPAAHHAASGGASILRTIIALVVVIGLIYLVARILRKVKGGETRATGDGLTHLATLPLAPGKSVALVRSGSDVVLVGIAESGVTPIKTYTEAEALANGIITPYEDAGAPAPVSAAGLVDGLRRLTVRT